MVTLPSNSTTAYMAQAAQSGCTNNLGNGCPVTIACPGTARSSPWTFTSSTSGGRVPRASMGLSYVYVYASMILCVLPQCHPQVPLKTKLAFLVTVDPDSITAPEATSETHLILSQQGPVPSVPTSLTMHPLTIPDPPLTPLWLKECHTNSHTLITLILPPFAEINSIPRLPASARCQTAVGTSNVGQRIKAPFAQS